MRKDVLIGGAFLFAAMLAIAGIVAYGMRPDANAPKTIAPKYEPVVFIPKKPEPPKKQSEIVRKIAIQPTTEESSAPKIQEPLPVKQVEPEPIVRIEPPVKAEPKVETPVLKPGFQEIVLGNMTKLNNAEGRFTVQTLNGEERVLIGKVKTLTIDGANTSALLDASELLAAEIVVAGDINGKSKILLHAPKGTVQFLREINGQSHIEVHASEGKVVFKSPHASIINGESKVVIVAKDVQLLGDINGTKTIVDVTLTAGGSLKFERLSGRAQLQYRCAAASDPEPRIEPGVIGPSAKLHKLEPTRK